MAVDGLPDEPETRLPDESIRETGDPPDRVDETVAGPVDETDFEQLDETDSGYPEADADEAVPTIAFDVVVASIEAMLYAASEPLSLKHLTKHLPEASDQVPAAFQRLRDLYDAEGRGLSIVEVAGGYQIVTRPEYHERISRLFHVKKPSRLSIQALETLSVVAYRQPVTIPEIMELRGVNSAGVIRTLLEKRLIKIVGRKNVVGRPLLYGTTKDFMLRFGLNTIKDLPQLQDMTELFGEDLAEQFQGLEDVLPPVTDQQILPLDENLDPAQVEHEEGDDSTGTAETESVASGADSDDDASDFDDDDSDDSDDDDSDDDDSDDDDSDDDDSDDDDSDDDDSDDDDSDDDDSDDDDSDDDDSDDEGR